MVNEKGREKSIHVLDWLIRLLTKVEFSITNLASSLKMLYLIGPDGLVNRGFYTFTKDGMVDCGTCA